MRQALLSILIALLACGTAHAGADTLTVTFGGAEKSYAAAELLARADAATIEIPADVSYKKPMTYRAVPLLALLGGKPDAALDTLEVSAADGFVSQIPMALIEGRATAAASPGSPCEDPAAPWPPLPGKDVSAGPFYLVWEHPERSKVGTELWPYQTVAVTGVESPAHRWPQMAVAATLAGRRSGATGAGGVHHAMHAVPSHEGRRRRRTRTRPRPAHEPDAIFHACGPARAHPQSQGRAHLAAAADAGVRCEGVARRRPRRRHRLPAPTWRRADQQGSIFLARA